MEKEVIYLLFHVFLISVSSEALNLRGKAPRVSTGEIPFDIRQSDTNKRNDFKSNFTIGDGGLLSGSSSYDATIGNNNSQALHNGLADTTINSQNIAHLHASVTEVGDRLVINASLTHEEGSGFVGNFSTGVGNIGIVQKQGSSGVIESSSDSSSVGLDNLNRLSNADNRAIRTDVIEGFPKIPAGPEHLREDLGRGNHNGQDIQDNNQKISENQNSSPSNYSNSNATLTTNGTISDQRPSQNPPIQSSTREANISSPKSQSKSKQRNPPEDSSTLI